MERLRFSFKFAFAFFAAILCSCVFTVITAVMGLSMLFASPFLGLRYTFTAISLFLLAPSIGLQLGFQYGHNILNTLTEPPYTPEQNAPLPVRSNILLRKIDALEFADDIKPLTEIEVRNFEELLETKKLPECEKYKKQLQKYNHYIQDSCGITFEPITQIQHLVTIEGTSTISHSNEKKQWTKSYDKNAIRSWIQTKGPHAKEPAIGCDLSDPRHNIHIYAGYPKWVIHFITLVKSMLALNVKTTVETRSDFTSQTIVESKIVTANASHSFGSDYPRLLFTTPVIEPSIDDNHDVKEQSSNLIGSSRLIG